MNKKLLAIFISMSLMSGTAISATVITSSNGSNIYNSQQPQNQVQQYKNNRQEIPNDYGMTANSRVEQEKEKAASPKTAAEQGFVSLEDQAELKERMENYIYNNTARQKGIVLHVPEENVGVARNKTDKMWLFNWKGRLLDKGISSEKIDFEASRLDKQDFERWASRQIRYADEK